VNPRVIDREIERDLPPQIESNRQPSIEGFERLAGKGISYGAARSEAANTDGLDIHIIGAGNSAGQAALFFSTHARSVTILCRGDTLEKSMSRYLID
jgi:thioredoxin reductase (NADPH)